MRHALQDTAQCAPRPAPRSAGTLKRLERDREDEGGKAMRELQRVSGIGVQRAKELMASGVTSLEELQRPENVARLSRGEQVGLLLNGGGGEEGVGGRKGWHG